MKVSILGTDYNIIFDKAADPELKGKNRIGYCFFDIKEIHVADLNTDEEWKKEATEARNSCANLVLRHEIIHAFLEESGLRQNSIDVESWAENEEMVDWMAIQFPKIYEAFKEAGCLN